MNKKDKFKNVDLGIGITDDNEFNEFETLIKDNQAKGKGKKKERMLKTERATLNFISDLYREFRLLVLSQDKKPNRVLEDLMKDYIKKNK
jgi:hypothetical protein